MTNWLEQLNLLTDDYYRWLREKTDIVPADGEWAVIATPFLGAFNDAVEIYARRKKNGTILLSDDGETIRNLQLQGCDILGAPRRLEIARSIARTRGVELDKHQGEILAEVAKDSDFPEKKNLLLSAILEMTDMAVLAHSAVGRLFKEDVREFFDEQGIIYTPDFECRGASGVHSTFDFHLAGKDREMVVKSFSSIDTPKVTDFLFRLGDVREQRERSRRNLFGLAVIQDIRQEAVNNPVSMPIPKKALTLLEYKGVGRVIWSERNTLENLAKIKMAA